MSYKSRWPDRHIDDVFLDKVDIIPGGCWLWTGGTNSKSGYGYFHINRKSLGPAKSHIAHRYMYLLVVGSIPPGLDLDHLCRVRHCVNPLHLEPVTRQVNLHRGVGSKPWVECKRGHDMAVTRKTYDNGKSQCQECHRARARGEMS